jgi:hypothetical protein
MNDELTLFGTTLPSAIWSAVIGAGSGVLVSVLTSWWTNRSTTQRFQRQLDHDHRLKVDERKSTIRKDVYLEAIAIANGTLARIGALAERELDSTTASSVTSELAIAIGKVTLVADPATALAARELNSRMNEMFIKLYPLAWEIQNARAPLRTIDAAIDSALEEQRRIYKEIVRENENGSHKDRLAQLFQSNDRQSELIQQFSQNRGKVHESVNPLRRRWVADLLLHGQPVQAQLQLLLSLLREEIHLPGAHAELADQLAEEKQRIERLLKDVVDSHLS